MNHIQEDHRIRIHTSYHIRDSFVGIWTSIAKQQHFLRLVLPSSPIQTPTREVIDLAIQRQDGHLSPYSSRIFENYQVIYQKRDVVIVTNALPSPSIGTFFAVEDADNPHRYFIAFAFPVGDAMESITGLFVYFNSAGLCLSPNTVICNRILANYDTRNGLIRASKLFLYHQSLVFTQIHRDTKRLLLFLCHVPYQTDSIENHVSYYTSYPSVGESISLFKRYLHIQLDSGTTLLFDLGSMDCIEENIFTPSVPSSLIEHHIHLYLMITTYHIPKREYIMGFLEVSQLFPEKEYSDGYPMYCAKCLQKAVTATYGYKSRPHYVIHTGLGSGYCPECRIRYSLTRKEWLCAEVCLDGTICDSYLYEGWSCCQSQAHSQDQSVIQLREGSFPKFPYRDRIKIQWVPTEDAKLCAETARMAIREDLYVLDTPPLKVEDVI